jgi:predicted nucleic acid-binding protein
VKVVVDASPLIALARIERLELLQKMFGGVVVPSAVWREVVAAGSDKTGASQVATADWICRQDVVDQSAVEHLRRDLGAGEAEAIVLAHELPADLLIMDEHLGRVTARDFGVHTVGFGWRVGRGAQARSCAGRGKHRRGFAPQGGILAFGRFAETDCWLRLNFLATAGTASG